MQNEDGSISLVIETKEETPSFLKEHVDLKPVLRLLKSASKTAIDTLLKCLESKDERIRLSAASKLIDLHVSVAKEISHDQMQRLIAEIKVASGGSTKKLVDAKGGDKEQGPIVDFTTIRQIS